MNNLIAKTIDLRLGNPSEKRQEIRNYFLKTWAIDELLYTQLKSDEVFYRRGDPLRHIILFYLGHTAVFFINKLYLAKIIDRRINPKFESTFAIGVDEMSWDDLDNNHYDWPSVAEVRAYRDEAKKAILDVIDQTTLELPIGWDNPFWIIMMGIEHERIHLETSSVLIRQLPLELLTPGLFGIRCPETGDAPENELIPVEGGIVKLGKPSDHPLYGWDNEYGNYEEEVANFAAAKFLTSNAEYLVFVEDNGYETQQYWTEEGWNWRNFKQATMPLFWRKDERGYRLRLVAEEIEMPWNWPVEVNYLEAKAFCNWKTARTGISFRLPTEAEWYQMHRVACLTDVTEWKQAPGNINLEHFASPCPVDRFAQGPFFDVIGNVWQWTETPITGFPGFKVHPMYDDFSTPTFDGKHNLIKGGSWISTGNEATIHSRYAFRRHFYQHAGFRYIQSDESPKIQYAEYETDEEVTRSCEENWGDSFAPERSLPLQLADMARDLLVGEGHKRILDLNADTGRLAFELARTHLDVTALDFTARMIRVPIQLQEQGYIRYTMKDEGDLVFYRDVVLDDFELTAVRNRIIFMQADAMNLKPNYTGYDLIIASALLEELSDPGFFLSQIHTRLNDSGFLLLASSYAWDLHKTKRDKWPGGFKQDGEPVTSLEGIEKILEPNFTLHAEPLDIRRTIKKSSRLTTQEMMQVTIWRKI
ncbi:5-histidylcysteine sulfoxide synthase [Proteiniphilum sp. UBA1028]|jgi:5-histidylcysteine sulfoxide synthase/putative 4-mercaptohistidine N1-methyltranferase|uniref:5-histidylcysteine sulfoxide synthase n=1 Tax=Proteiniphilum sp. UBA1028 TaxID=1947251 RepID=UPI0025D0028E|nr:5-histidylcysteine sulfoxide synthase [Proteiniphilum sp. UBA1028]